MANGMSATRRIAADALFTALALIMFLIENLFPPLFFPGAKMGLSNIFSLAALVLFSPVDAFAVVAVRSLLGAAFSGNFSAVMYSFSGGVTAMLVSSVLMYAVYPRVSLMSVSIAAAVVHNIMQTLVAAAWQSAAVFAYMPYLALIGVFSGAAVGAVVMLIFKRVPISVYEKFIGRKRVLRTGEQACSPEEDGAERGG